jgi:nitrogen fixation-related uncharacterized protein
MDYYTITLIILGIIALAGILWVQTSKSFQDKKSE